MSRYVLPGTLGLLVGLLLHWAGFSRQEGLRSALGLRRSLPLCSGLTAIGWAMALAALLCWLAVIDVDTIEVLPLSFGVLAGGALLGVAGGLCGFTPSTAFAGLGAGNALEGLCVLAGCALTTLLLPALDGILSPLRQAAPYSAATLFKVTLDEPFLLGGGFLGQGCAGAIAIITAMAAVFGMRNAECRTEHQTRADEVSKPSDIPGTSAEDDASPSGDPDAPDSDDPPAVPGAPDPEDAAEDTFVALLPGEEPLVIDTEMESPDSSAENDADPTS